MIPNVCEAPCSHSRISVMGGQTFPNLMFSLSRLCFLPDNLPFTSSQWQTGGVLGSLQRIALTMQTFMIYCYFATFSLSSKPRYAIQTPISHPIRSDGGTTP